MYEKYDNTLIRIIITTTYHKLTKIDQRLPYALTAHYHEMQSRERETERKKEGY